MCLGWWWDFKGWNQHLFEKKGKKSSLLWPFKKFRQINIFGNFFCDNLKFHEMFCTFFEILEHSVHTFTKGKVLVSSHWSKLRDYHANFLSFQTTTTPFGFKGAKNVWRSLKAEYTLICKFFQEHTSFSRNFTCCCQFHGIFTRIYNTIKPFLHTTKGISIIV